MNKSNEECDPFCTQTKNTLMLILHRILKMTLIL